jgi:ribonuclease E
LTLRASQEATIYVLNKKRADIAEIEDRYGVTVEILPDREEEGARMSVEASGGPPAHAPRIEPLVDLGDDEDVVEEVEVDIEDDEVEEVSAGDREERRGEGDGNGRKRRRRRRGRGRGRDEGGEQQPLSADGEQDPEAGEDEAEFVGEQPADVGEPQEGEGDGRRRRGRRGRRGRRRGGQGDITADTLNEADVAAGQTLEDEIEAVPDVEPETIEAGDAGHVSTTLDIRPGKRTKSPRRAAGPAPARRRRARTPPRRRSKPYRRPGARWTATLP